MQNFSYHRIFSEFRVSVTKGLLSLTKTSEYIVKSDLTDFLESFTGFI